MINRSCDLREEKLFLIGYILWLIDTIIGITMWNDVAIINDIGNYLYRMAYIFFVIQFLLKKQYTKKDVIGVLMIIFIAILGNKSVNNKYIIRTMILIYFSANVDFKKILKCTLVVQAAFMVVTIYSSQVGVIEDVIWDNYGTRYRQSLGYDYCGYPAHIALFLTTIWFCLRKRVKLPEVILAVGLNYVIYYLTDSRADFFLCLLAVWGFTLIKKQYKMQFWMKYGFMIISVASILLHLVYGLGLGVISELNRMLSNRLELGYKAIVNYGFSLFGKVISWTGMGGIRSNPELIYNYVDCAYLKEILSYGIVFWIVLAVAFYYLGKNLIYFEDYKLAWAMIIALLYAVVNAHLCMPVFNPFILALGKACPISKSRIDAEYKSGMKTILKV